MNTDRTPKHELDYAIEFTKLYKSIPDPSLREAACLDFQLQHILTHPIETDLFAGSMRHGYVGFSPQYGGVYTYYYHGHQVQRALKNTPDLSPEYIAEVENLHKFWEKENTTTKYLARFSEKYTPPTPDSYYTISSRLSGVSLDFKPLMELGLHGLRKYVRSQGCSNFYNGVVDALHSVTSACETYAIYCEQLAKITNGKRKQELEEMDQILDKISMYKPETFREGLQLMWIYSICSDLTNYGRMDVYLGDLYATDIAAGRETFDSAVTLLRSIFRLMVRMGKIHDARVIIGGEGRPNEENANELALAIIEASTQEMQVIPQLTLRYHSGIDPRLMEATLRSIQKGHVYPIVYSDDATIPAMEKIMNIPREMAQNWVPFGCGEYVLEGYSVGTPNTLIMFCNMLDILLHGGYNSFTGVKVLDGYENVNYITFEDLMAAYKSLVIPAAAHGAYSEECNYAVAGEEASFLLYSLLMHDCIERGKPLLTGGVRYLCATNETLGIMTCADSLMAIKRYVYEEKRFTLAQLVQMLDANFEGYEKERQLLLAAPKYGNDINEVDELANELFAMVSDIHLEAGKSTNLYRYNVVSVTNSASADVGATTAATPDGRKRGEPLNNGNSPAIAAEKSGLTAALNSMTKMDSTKHMGVTHNIRLNRDFLNEKFDLIKHVLETFYENGGVQTNLSCVGKDDLQQALQHPERYQNLMVRIGGFSARFVELGPVVQHEILLRTTHEG